MTHNELVLHTRRVMEAVESRQCFCGQVKVRKLPICRRCYHKLPEEMRGGLHQTFENGLLQAYDEAKTYLQSR